MDFAALFEAAAREKGYTVRSIISTELNHAWNEVKLSGKWWIVDTAWNTPGEHSKKESLRFDEDILHRFS